jgi:hypothetical protein
LGNYCLATTAYASKSILPARAPWPGTWQVPRRVVMKP